MLTFFTPHNQVIINIKTKTTTKNKRIILGSDNISDFFAHRRKQHIETQGI